MTASPNQIASDAAKLDPRPRFRRFLDGFGVILVPAATTVRLAKADWAVTRLRQPELASAAEEITQRHLNSTENLARFRVARLRVVHTRTIVLLLSALIVGMFFGRVTPTTWVRGREYYALASVFIFAWATLARLGWTAQSIKGDSAIERIDETWFRSLYWLATALAAAAVA